MSKTVAIIGGGIAGIETSIQLEKLGYEVNLYEKDSALGGHAAKWDRLFPNRRHAFEVINGFGRSFQEVGFFPKLAFKGIVLFAAKFAFPTHNPPAGFIYLCPQFCILIQNALPVSPDRLN